MNVPDVAWKIQTLCGKNKPIVNPLKVPQQQNSHDCGMYVLCFMEAIVTQVTQGKRSIDDIDLSAVTPQNVAKKRGQILEIVEKLIQEK